MITAEARAGSTRERLIGAALDLFAAQGFRSTTVGQIEAAAGLQPRRGALYKHFGSKREVLEAVVSQHLESVREGVAWVLRMPPGDVRTEAALLGRFALDELVRERSVVDLLERDGDRIPELRDLFRVRVCDVAYRAMADILRRWVGDRGDPDADLDAQAVLLLGGLINVHRSDATFGGTPLDRTEADLLAAWADQCAGTVETLRR
ncbi:MAG: TetR/AcrR family transcriptional regulator [Nocardioidaceae bacterium]